MAFDVTALLKGYNDATAALLRSAGLTGGAAAPDEPATQVGAAEASTGASEDSPIAKYLAGQATHNRQSGLGGLEQLAMSGGRMRSSTSGWEAASPVTALSPGSQGNALQRAIGVRQGGPRAGEAFTAYDLGDGRRAHVSFDAKGKRQVFVFRPKG
jgi:hypothetical protein